MKKLFPFFLLSLICFAVDAQDKPFLTKSFNSSQIRELDVKTSGGGITVYGTNDSETVVQVFIKSNNGKELSQSEIEDHLKDYTLEINREGQTLVCMAQNNRKNNWKNGLSISFKVYAPEQLDTDLLTSGGGIRMKNLEGNLRFATSGGGLELVELRGNVKGRTSGGGIKIKDSEDIIDLATSGGGIMAENVAGQVKLSTSGGGIKLYDMYGMISATTSGGSILVEGLEGELKTGTSGGSIRLADISGSVKASTSGGSINADIREVGEYLVLHSSGGGIDVDLPFDKGMDLDIKGNRVTMNNYRNFDGRKDKDRIVGTINGGGAEVSISTSSGSVNIR
ncbi:DUF4097 family beta strand repeat-containing protein [Jiulongibacter sediminis]|uniref:DUF4097 domain-containing protein n=1 Tax=Jiulongibacter sediminis TaxID=1605367 RepID=A0A0P7BT11_9BACT|nr:DUF4097 family beta strand repeat-containing protein [Jiulongibacter sediminis]KPM47624.1 hypothetical protein AFM12_14125 [Jiulongibacter sediminis]TBX23415.1 hypothetical protein TK44_14135 [Jiulongibacter sediminis]